MQRFDVYQVKVNDDLADPTFWDFRFQDIDARLNARELDAQKISDAADELIAVGIARVNVTFNPLIDAATQKMADATALMNSASDQVNTTVANATTGFNAAIATANANLTTFMTQATQRINEAEIGIVDDGSF